VNGDLHLLCYHILEYTAADFSNNFAKVEYSFQIVCNYISLKFKNLRALWEKRKEWLAFTRQKWYRKYKPSWGIPWWKFPRSYQHFPQWKRPRTAWKQYIW